MTLWRRWRLFTIYHFFKSILFHQYLICCAGIWNRRVSWWLTLFNSRLYIKHCEILNRFDPYNGAYEYDHIQSFDVKGSDTVNEDHISGKNGSSYTENLQIECSYLGSVNTSCGFCGESYNLESQCTGCRKPSIYCSICRMPVFGLASTCFNCNHGGHTLHIQQWFQDW